MLRYQKEKNHLLQKNYSILDHEVDFRGFLSRSSFQIFMLHSWIQWEKKCVLLSTLSENSDLMGFDRFKIVPSISHKIRVIVLSMILLYHEQQPISRIFCLGHSHSWLPEGKSSCIRCLLMKKKKIETK